MNEPKIENTEISSPDILPEGTTQNIASRGSRLGASLLDSLVMMLFTIPTMYFTGGFDGVSKGVEPSLFYSIGIGLFGLMIFLLINFKLLKDAGQTVGKKIIGIKIVDTAGEPASWGKHYVKRYSVFFIPGQIPLVGQIFSIINILFIFGKQKRCIHDFAAGTQVIKCS